MKTTTSLIALLISSLTVSAWGPKDEARHGWHGPPRGYGQPRKHDHTFVPDEVLRLTYHNVSIACQSRASALVNGTTPGPPLYMKPGKTTWVRVYNDMEDYNATIVSLAQLYTLECSLTICSTGMVLANDLRSSPMAHLQRRSGPFHPCTSSTTKSIQSQTTLERTFTIHTLASRWVQRQDP